METTKEKIAILWMPISAAKARERLLKYSAQEREELLEAGIVGDIPKDI